MRFTDGLSAGGEAVEGEAGGQELPGGVGHHQLRPPANVGGQQPGELLSVLRLVQRQAEALRERQGQLCLVTAAAQTACTSQVNCGNDLVTGLTFVMPGDVDDVENVGREGGGLCGVEAGPGGEEGRPHGDQAGG